MSKFYLIFAYIVKARINVTSSAIMESILTAGLSFAVTEDESSIIHSKDNITIKNSPINVGLDVRIFIPYSAMLRIKFP
jgi:hypothetical protein